MAFRNPIYQLSNTEDLNLDIINAPSLENSRRSSATLAVCTTEDSKFLYGTTPSGGAEWCSEGINSVRPSKRLLRRRRHVPRWISDSFRTCLPKSSGNLKEQALQPSLDRNPCRNGQADEALRNKRIGIAEPSNYWHGIIEETYDEHHQRQRNLHLIPENWQDVNLKNGLVAIIDLATDHLQCSKLIIYVDKHLPNLPYLVKSFHWVGFEPIAHPNCVDHAVFGMDL
uniref:Ornithine decarboxylase antizyme n=1 Tax=Schizosaccharomyces japonicus TaxID=4897 RepID=OAZ_SCHJP|nr:RecName: Full=Ornithine decarboxylase antizyme; Short=ODC-Az [Schizosaccharomyces japonicus]AAG16232.1 ornithine decarboxylase antizyme [Schizosaccharomyces japonicus]